MLAKCLPCFFKTDSRKSNAVSITVLEIPSPENLNLSRPLPPASNGKIDENKSFKSDAKSDDKSSPRSTSYLKSERTIIAQKYSFDPLPEIPKRKLKAEVASMSCGEPSAKTEVCQEKTKKVRMSLKEMI
mmetsp:Transcript_303/g.348  ORF Transcript_303/g.348 Transcript_303/m.348 type:complete len:130 (+) Transcript_303:44-433(+)